MNSFLRPYRTLEFLEDSTFDEMCNYVHNNNYKNGFYDRMSEDGFFQNQQLKIIGEFSELFEARRSEDYAKDVVDIKYVVKKGISREDFKKHVKDKFEDELADLMIYSMDWIGSPLESEKSTSEGYSAWRVVLQEDQSDFDLYIAMYSFIENGFYKNPHNIIHFCKRIAKVYNVNLEYHIYAKLEYNTQRGRLHGKTS